MESNSEKIQFELSKALIEKVEYLIASQSDLASKSIK